MPTSPAQSDVGEPAVAGGQSTDWVGALWRYLYNLFWTILGYNLGTAGVQAALSRDGEDHPAAGQHSGTSTGQGGITLCEALTNLSTSLHSATSDHNHWQEHCLTCINEIFTSSECIIVPVICDASCDDSTTSQSITSLVTHNQCDSIIPSVTECDVISKRLTDLSVTDQHYITDNIPSTSLHQHTYVSCLPIRTTSTSHHHRQPLNVIIVYSSEDSLESCHQQATLLHSLLQSSYNSISMTSRHNTTTQPDAQSLLTLCGDLYDEDPRELQVKIISYICSRVTCRTGFILLISEDTEELYCQVVGTHKLNSEVRFAMDNFNSLGTAIKHKQPVVINDIPKDVQYMLEWCDQDAQYHYTQKQMLCVPVTCKVGKDVKIIMCLVDKGEMSQFSSSDMRVVDECFNCTLPILLRSISLHRERILHADTQALLEVAKKLFVHLDDVTLLLKDIMHEARNLVHAQCCSVFLHDSESKELVAKIFDEGGYNKNSNPDSVREVRLPDDQGIAGHVFTTGHLLNIKDAYAHPLFYKEVDLTTGFKTKNILCFPIRDEMGVIGIAEMVNKINAPYFTSFDENIATAFSVYCGLSIVHSLMYKKVLDAQNRNRLMNELMMYHMNLSNEEVEKICSEPIKSPEEYSPNFSLYKYSPRMVPQDSTVQVGDVM